MPIFKKIKARRDKRRKARYIELEWINKHAMNKKDEEEV